MKTKSYICSMALLTLGLAACNDDHKPDWTEKAPFDVKVESVSIDNGATVAVSTDRIEILYSNDVVLNPRAEITMTGNALTGSEIQDGKRLVATFSLMKGKTYTLTIPANAVAGIGS